MSLPKPSGAGLNEYSEMKAPLLLAVCAWLFAAGALGQVDCSNPHDSNSDGAVTISDLLDLLGLFGDVDTDQDGIWDSVDDCVDITACNYAAIPTEVCAYIDVLGECGGGCEGDGDGDGICDDVDTCVGDLDECGVCNGPGPTEIVIDEIVITYDSIYLPVDGEWFVYAVDVDTTFSYTCAPFFGNCGDPVSYQGYDYATVLIGDQCWFAENLRSENYESGGVIFSDLDWVWDVTCTGADPFPYGAVGVYGQGDSECYNNVCYCNSPEINACDPLQSLEEYGRLYNWNAVNDSRGLCPSGWHVPSDDEWMAMISELGGESIAGGKMKTSYGWYQGGNGTNASGFSGLPGGRLGCPNGIYGIAGEIGYWWSSSTSVSNPSSAWMISLYHGSENANLYSLNKTRGLSVRCVQDAE